jgi:putative phosphoribosyl transferase
MRFFKDRREAGKLLGERLINYANKSDVLVLALPRGGVPVAFEVAKKLNATLDIFIVRKLGVPGHEELAMGAIATGGVRVLNEEVLNMINIPQLAIEEVTHRELLEMRRREEQYRGKRAEPVIAGKTIIIVDDGLATGSTMRAAVIALKRQGPASITVAVPVADPGVCNQFRQIADDVVCAVTPGSLGAVGRWYEDFSQTTDEEVIELLNQAKLFAPQEIKGSI